MMLEAGVVIGIGGDVIHWHLPTDRSSGFLPDSRPLWDVIWENRKTVLGVAHSHPGMGIPGPSPEDITTFSAIERALGRQLRWWITSSDQVGVFQWVGPDLYKYEGRVIAPHECEKTLLWIPQLRKLSNYLTTNGERND